MSESKSQVEICKGVAEKWRGLFMDSNAEWQKAEAKLRAIGEVLARHGCDGECNCVVGEGHDDDCDEFCFACEINQILEGKQ